MSSPTTFSPLFQGYARATKFKAQEVEGRNAISDERAPMKRAAFARASSIARYQERQSAAPRSRTLSRCAAIACATRRGSGATAAWFQ
jgi:hypothetical protein